MKKRTWLLFVGLLMGVLAVVIFDQFFVFRPGITETNVNRIKNCNGMTLEEVQRILDSLPTYTKYEESLDSRVVVEHIWDRQGHVARVVFEHNGDGRWQSVWASYSTSKPGLLKRIRGRLGW